MEKILNSILIMYLDCEIEGIMPICNDDITKEIDCEIAAILDKLGASQSEAITIDDDICRVSAEAEQWGFLNGLKVGVRLAKELGVIV